MSKKPTSRVDHVIDHLIDTVNSSKNEMYDIVETTRKEQKLLLNRLETVKEEMLATFEQTEALQQQFRAARAKLSEASALFGERNESNIKAAYEKANDIQIKLALSKQTEKSLIRQRNDIQRRLNVLERTIEKADGVMTKFSVITNFLAKDVKELGQVMNIAQERHALGVRILELQEEERKRISREIHDGPAQMIANLLLRSELLERIYREKGAEEAITETRALRAQVRGSLHEVRRIIYDLRPMALDDLGLIPALKKYLKNIEEYNKIPIKFISNTSNKRVEGPMETALFRIIQEAVQNTLKHARASQIAVKVDVTDDTVYLVIRDDGVGFDPELKKDGSFGLKGIQERVELLRGTVAIQSGAGSGTSVIVKVPINKQDEEQVEGGTNED
ncbi:MAG: sensor histidine kinase [Bacilli bacterium]